MVEGVPILLAPTVWSKMRTLTRTLVTLYLGGLGLPRSDGAEIAQESDTVINQWNLLMLSRLVVQVG